MIPIRWSRTLRCTYFSRNIVYISACTRYGVRAVGADRRFPLPCCMCGGWKFLRNGRHANRRKSICTQVENVADDHQKWRMEVLEHWRDKSLVGVTFLRAGKSKYDVDGNFVDCLLNFPQHDDYRGRRCCACAWGGCLGASLANGTSVDTVAAG